MKIILASTSPRRQELLRQIGLTFTVAASNFTELSPSGWTPESYARANAEGKAVAAAKDMAANAAVLAADTIVALDGEIFGKPRDAADAKNMLGQLSGRTHEVFTGLALAAGGRVFGLTEKTLVTIRKLDDKDIANYVATGEPLDKAGAYGIQGKGALLIERIEGCYYNVVGLPLAAMLKLFKEAGIMIEY